MDITTPAVPSNGFSALFWGSISRSSVPIFLMVSGALMLDPARKVTLKKLWTRSIPRFLLALLVWAFAYQLYHQIQAGGFSAAILLQAAKETLAFHHEFHLYYLHIMLLVYALLPATQLITAQASKGTLQYLLILWTVLATVCWAGTCAAAPFQPGNGRRREWAFCWFSAV